MRRVCLLALVGLLIPAAPAAGATLEPVGTFTNPTYVTSYPQDPNRLLVVERAGQIRLVSEGTTTTFLDIRALVGTITGERGLLSIALAPDFAATGKFYAFYVGSATAGDLQIDEFTASGNSVDAATRRPVLTIDHPDRPNHNGGQLQIGPDGYLYISTGDGDTASEVAQNRDSLLGKILRIDPRQNGESPYRVPASNPFVGTAGADEIWSLGLRNPYRFSFDRASGAFAIGDVGQNLWEEVDYEPQPAAGRGSNYGWPCYEARIVRRNLPECANATFVFPVFDYPHENGNCSVIGGYVARDRSLGDLYGRYLYADLCVGEIRSFTPNLPMTSDDRSEGMSVTTPVSFGEDACGRLYVVSLQGPVSRLVGDPPASGLCPLPRTAPHIKNGANPIVGTKLGSERGTWTGEPTTYRAQWLRCDAVATSECAAATPYRVGVGTYRPVGVDVGQRLRVSFIATNAEGESAPARSAPSGIVAEAVPTNSTPPKIKNAANPVVGTKLGAERGSWTGDPTSYRIQWRRCDAVDTNACTDLTPYRTGVGTYTPAPADAGSRLRISVIATNTAGDSTPALSDPSGVVSE